MYVYVCGSDMRPCSARLRQEGIPGMTIRLVDTAGDVGGTWYWNRYVEVTSKSVQDTWFLLHVQYIYVHDVVLVYSYGGT